MTLVLKIAISSLGFLFFKLGYLAKKKKEVSFLAGTDQPSLNVLITDAVPRITAAGKYSRF
jgi:hypothetical protein